MKASTSTTSTSTPPKKRKSIVAFLCVGTCIIFFDILVSKRLTKIAGVRRETSEQQPQQPGDLQQEQQQSTTTTTTTNETSFFAFLSAAATSMARPTLQQQQQLPSDQLKLRYDWTNLERISPWSKYIASYQSDCSIPAANFSFFKAGLGSHIHTYSQIMCNAMEKRLYRIRSMFPWSYMDTERCTAAATAMNQTLLSPFTCYFPEPETVCPDDAMEREDRKVLNLDEILGNRCGSITKNVSIPDYRAATTEYLFTRLSPVVIEEAERQLKLLFGGSNNSSSGSSRVPPNLVTVHLRWGDKKKEMELVAAVDYVNAVHDLIKADPTMDPDNINIYLATEDPEALEAFKSAAPSSWTIYIDQYYTETLADRDGSHYGMVKMTDRLSGRPGLVAMGSVLVAMEANKFVLTTASNWSRLMNELRKNVLDPRCNHCTSMIDLRSGAGKGYLFE